MYVTYKYYVGRKALKVIIFIFIHYSYSLPTISHHPFALLRIRHWCMEKDIYLNVLYLKKKRATFALASEGCS